MTFLFHHIAEICSACGAEKYTVTSLTDGVSATDWYIGYLFSTASNSSSSSLWGIVAPPVVSTQYLFLGSKISSSSWPRELAFSHFLTQHKDICNLREWVDRRLLAVNCSTNSNSVNNNNTIPKDKNTQQWDTPLHPFCSLPWWRQRRPLFRSLTTVPHPEQLQLARFLFTQQQRPRRMMRQLQSTLGSRDWPWCSMTVLASRTLLHRIQPL